MEMNLYYFSSFAHSWSAKAHMLAFYEHFSWLMIINNINKNDVIEPHAFELFCVGGERERREFMSLIQMRPWRRSVNEEKWLDCNWTSPKFFEVTQSSTKMKEMLWEPYNSESLRNVEDHWKRNWQKFQSSNQIKLVNLTIFVIFNN